MSTVNRILIICRRNLSRSVVAEAIFRHELQKQNRTDIIVQSAGIFVNYEGRSAGTGILKILSSLGINGSSHGRVGLTGSILEDASLVLVADNYCLHALHRLFPQFKDKIRLLLDKEIPDIKWTQRERYLAEVVEPIRRAAASLLKPRIRVSLRPSISTSS
jgi:protein-tyrosine-phosphatase